MSHGKLRAARCAIVRNAHGFGHVWATVRKKHASRLSGRAPVTSLLSEPWQPFFSLGKTMSSKSAAFRRLSARRTVLVQPGPCGMARAFSIAVTAFFQVPTLMAKSFLISSEHLCLVAMVRASISRLRAHQPSYAFITAMLLKPAKAFRQLPQIVSIWADR